MPNPTTESGRRQIGTSGIYVSPVAFGTWPIAGMTSLEVNEIDSLETIRAAVDSGINFIDTAHCYGANGESEKLIGKAIAQDREQLVIASKGGIHWDQDVVRHYDGRPKTLIAQCEQSLDRMKVGVIDLYYLHAPDPNVSVSDSATAFNKLIESGKIRAVGVSNLDLTQIKAFNAVCPISAIQPPFNMLQQEICSEITPWCLANEVSIINYWPLMKGLLAGKIRRGHQFAAEDKRLTYSIFHGQPFESAQQLLDGLDKIAEKTGRSVAQIVINWTMNQPGITSSLCGGKRAWQIKETAGAMDWQLEPEYLVAITELIQSLKIN
ncbi:MAG: aldo/keto reductase [Planctomycetaceae bacterium]|nr:aldo/keto reductase [Planctomycetaceae bacterium]